MSGAEIVKIWLPKFVPSSTSLNAVRARGAGAAAAMLLVAVLAAAGVLLVLVLVPCDTSPGGLLTTMTPRSTYKTVTPGCGRPRACFVAESIRVRAVPAAASMVARGPARRRALTELPWPCASGTSSSNPIGSIPRACARGGSVFKIGNWQYVCVLVFLCFAGK